MGDRVGEMGNDTNAAYASHAAQSPFFMLRASVHPFEDLGQDGLDGVRVVLEGEIAHGEVVVEARGFDQRVRRAVELVRHDDGVVQGVGEAVG